MEPRWSGHFWYIFTSAANSADEYMAEYFALSLEEYRNVLKTCGGYNSSDWDLEVIFDNSKDVERAIATLEPYLIMKKLMS